MTVMKAAVLGAVLVPLLAGCATRGQVRTLQGELEAERAARASADQQLGADVASLRTDLASLRNDLQALRSEFDARIVAVEQGLQFALPVHFAFDDATVRAQDQPALERFASIVSRHYTGAVVTVEGFADPAGSASYNRTLSQRRADAVRDRLVGLGIEAQVRTIGLGETRLVVDGAAKDDPGAELNRRVVFVIESPAARQALTVLEGGEDS